VEAFCKNHQENCRGFHGFTTLVERIGQLKKNVVVLVLPVSAVISKSA
jgi:hypothetical protein